MTQRRAVVGVAGSVAVMGVVTGAKLVEVKPAQVGFVPVRSSCA